MSNIWSILTALVFLSSCTHSQWRGVGPSLKESSPGGPLSMGGSGPSTAWYINGELCGNSNPVGYKDPTTGKTSSVWGMDCDIKFIPTPTPVAGVPPGKRMWPPLPLYLNDKPIGTLCSFMQRKQDIETVDCALLMNGPAVAPPTPTPIPTPAKTATPIPTPTPRPTPPNKCPTTCPAGKSCTAIDCGAFGRCYCQ